MNSSTIKIVHTEYGYYALLVDGKFAGNYDSVSEAEKEFDNYMEEYENGTDKNNSSSETWF